MDFYRDSIENGFAVADKNAKRNAQKSRLKKLGDESVEWWDDFITFVYEKDVTKRVIEFVEYLSKHTFMKTSEYRYALEAINYILNR